MMRQTTFCLTALLTVGCLVGGLSMAGCDRSDSAAVAGEGGAENGGSESAGPQTVAEDEPALAVDLAERLGTLEVGRDVTGWTPFRLMEGYVAGKPLTHAGTLTKTLSAWALMRAVWQQAAGRAEGDTLEEATLLEVLDPADLADWSGDPGKLKDYASNLGLKNFHDYRNTGEHWRLLLSVVQQDIYRGGGGLKMPTEAALKVLAEQATHLTLALLKKAGKAAEADKSDRIDHRHVKEAYRALRKAHDLKNAPSESKRPSRERIRQTLHPPAKAVIAGKIKALRAQNAAPDLLEALNSSGDVDLTGAGLRALKGNIKAQLKSIATGEGVMRSDTFFGDPSSQPQDLEPGKRRPYLTAGWTQNQVMQLLPHATVPNGDIRFRLVPSPAAPTDEEKHPEGFEMKSFDIRVLSHEIEAVRDTALHWVILQELAAAHPFAADVYATEYLAETAALFAALYLHRLESQNTDGGALGRRVAGQLQRFQLYTRVHPDENRQHRWGDEERAAKKQLLADYPTRLFRIRTGPAGFPESLDMSQRPSRGFDHSFNMAMAMGSGVGVGDPNGDGWPDVYLGGAGMGRLFINRGPEAPGRFVDRTEEWGIPTEPTDTRQALFFDLEGDGDEDLLVLRWRHQSMLLENKGDHFEDVATDRNLYTHDGAHAAAIFDYDGDGRLDIYIGYYGRDDVNRMKKDVSNLPSVDGRNGSPNQLWRQKEDGEFELVSEEAGVGDLGWALAMQAFDYNRDGHPDLAVANDFGANRLFENNADGTFTDVTKRTHTGDRGSGMNISISDIDGDGWWDFFLSNIDMFASGTKIVFPEDESIVDIDEAVQHSFQYLTGNKLYLNRPARTARETEEADSSRRLFRADEHKRFEPGDQGWAWDGNFFDVENDGDEDLYVSNGWIADSYAESQPNKLYIHDDGRFYLFSEDDAGASFHHNSRGVAAFDADRDGDQDLLVNNFRAAPTFLENRQSAGHNWLQLQLRQEGPNSRAIGAEVVVETGEKKQMRLVSCGRGYISQDDIVEHVGLGDAREADVTVRWPDGTQQRWEGLAAGKRHVLEKKD